MYPNTKVENNVYNTEESLLLHYTKLYEIWYDEENKERKSSINLYYIIHNRIMWHIVHTVTDIICIQY